jgi:hypothetical protein
MKTVKDTSGTAITVGDRVIWTASSTKKGMPRKGVLVSLSEINDWSGTKKVVAEFVVLVATHYWRTGKTRYRICRRRHVLNENLQVQQVVKADYALTVEETNTIRSRSVKLPAAPFWSISS